MCMPLALRVQSFFDFCPLVLDRELLTNLMRVNMMIFNTREYDLLRAKGIVVLEIFE